MKHFILKIFYVYLFLAISSVKCGNISTECLSYDQNTISCANENIYNIVSSVSSIPIFENTTLIEIPPYFYPTPNESVSFFGNFVELRGDSTNLFFDLNDCCLLISKLDKHPTNPTFEWNNVSSSLVAAAIFKNEIKVSLDGERIDNVDDIVWTWNSGMNTGIQSSGKTVVNFTDGKDVSNGEILESITPLSHGQVYIIAVWAWNESGTEIEFSSRAVPFLINSIQGVTITPQKWIEGTWKLDTAILIVGNRKTFPIQRFWIMSECESNDGPLLSIHAINSLPPFESVFATVELRDSLQEKIFLGDLVELSNVKLLCEEMLHGFAQVDSGSFEVYFRRRF